MMSLHKLTAGDGYEYLTKQVAANDGTELGAKDSLEAYYSAKGEAPGRWLGSGLIAFDDISTGDVVTSEQMKALWGEGRHPNATAIEATMIGEGHSAAVAVAATRLGSPFKIYSGATDFQQAVAQAFAEHNTARGVKARAEISAEDRARIRTRVATAMFTTEFGRSPADSRELSGWIAQKTRQKTTAVAGYDLTFSPVKSVSTLWAVAPRGIAERIEAAHQRAVEKTIASLERDIAYTRIGTNGVARVQADGLIAAAFTHRDSRAGDPDLHTHVPISNKVRYTGPDGIQRWGALDGKPLHRLAVQASEEYNSRLEAEMIAEFPGVHFADRDPGILGKRPVRELVGVSPDLAARWSARTRSIEDRSAELVDQFQAQHGREPTAVEHIALRQQANLDTREAKHEPRSLAEQRATWRREAAATLGSEQAVARMVSAGLGIDTDRPVNAALAAEVRRLEGEAWLNLTPTAAAAVVADRDTLRVRAHHNLTTAGPRPPHELSVDDAARYGGLAVSKVALTRSRWQTHHVRAEAMRQARLLGIGSDHLTAVADQITAAALAQHCIQITHARRDGDLGEPSILRTGAGESVFVDHGADYWTSREVLAAERRIVATARLNDGHRIDPIHVDIALLEHEANTYALNAGQQALVREFATAGARFHLALAPAGTGKTSAMAAFTTAWTAAGGTVIGLAPTANAAQVLGRDIGQHADTLDKYAHILAELRAATDDARRAQILAKAPDWFHAIGPGAVVLIDEVGMSSTASLDPVIADAIARGADVKAVGDDQQLASVAAGGVLRDVAEHGNTLTLSEVMRFTDDAEGAASLAMREGRDEAIGYYIDHHRVHVAAESTAADIAYQAWRRDTQAGRASVMLAPTLDTVRALNERARTDRLADHPLSTADKLRGRGREIALADGLTASAGDTIRTRRNNRDLVLSGTDFVRNGYRWTITHVSKNGELTVTHDRSRATITLPAWYVTQHCELGYASTIHAAQGMTVGSRGKQIGTCHIVGSDQIDKQLLYVAMTRATDANHLYLGTSEADPHKIVFDRALRPPTAVDMLRRILARDGTQQSATTAAREATLASSRLPGVGDAYTFGVGALAEHLLGRDVMAAIDAGAAEHHTGLTDQPAWPVLRQHLAILALERPTPAQPAADYALTRLGSAIAGRELDTAMDAAAVLDWRLDHSGNHSARPGPLPWLPAIPHTLATHDEYGPYLLRRQQRVTQLADSIRRQAHHWTVHTAPRWARPLIVGDGDHRELLADIAVFRAAHRVDDRDKRPTGPAQYALTRRHHQNSLDRRFAEALDLHGSDTSRWQPLAEALDPHIVRDPFWPDLAERLSVAARAGVDVHTLLTTAAAETPLPTELPAAALWWRVADTLEPAVLDTAHSAIRVPWAHELGRIVGDDVAEAIFTDPAWPALAAAVAAAHPREWTPATILATAEELLRAGGTGDHIRTDEYARALAWRVDLLASHSRHATDIPLPADAPLSVDDEEQAPPDPDADHSHRTPDELHTTPTADLPETLTTVDDPDHDYLDALTASEPPLGDDTPENYTTPDDLGDLDFGDLATARPTALLDAPITDPADLDELRAQAAAAHADIEKLHAHILDPTRDSPHLAAAGPYLAEQRRLAELHRPAIHQLAAAHSDWVEADLAAEAAEAALAHHTAELAAATGPDGPTDPERHTQLLGQREIAEIQAAERRAHAEDMLARLTTASAALDELAPEGVITDRDVTRARLHAERADLDDLARLRHTAQRLDGRVFRAENAHARRRAAATALPAPLEPSSTSRPQPAASRKAAPVAVLDVVGTDLTALRGDYHTAINRLHTHQVRTAAAVFGDAAAEVLATDPNRGDLATALAEAYRHHITPTTALHDAARLAATPDAAGLAAAVTAATARRAREQSTLWQRTNIAALQHAWPTADTTSPAWNTLCDKLYQHSLAGHTTTDMIHTLTSTAPMLATTEELLAALPRAYPPDTAPDWIRPPAALPGDDPRLFEDAATAHRDYRAAHTSDTTTAAPEILGPRPDDVTSATLWDSAASHLRAYQREYGTPATDLSADATPDQQAAHAALHARLEDYAAHRRAQHLDYLDHLTEQRATSQSRTETPIAPQHDPTIHHRPRM